jgi:hypothetical protein
MADFQRSTAKICEIRDIVNNKFIKKEGWDPSYVLSEFGKLMRVNLLGVIVSKENNSCTLDDGTGKIIVRNFIGSINSEIGELATVIGKPRVFNNETFVNAEIIKSLKNKKWVEYRKKILSLREKQTIIQEEDYIDDSKVSEVKVDKKEKIEESNKTETSKELEPIVQEKVIEKKVTETIGKAELIIKLIDKLDNGSGAAMPEVITQSKIEDAEKLIKNLMEEGEIFQIKPGMLKVM